MPGRRSLSIDGLSALEVRGKSLGALELCACISISIGQVVIHGFKQASAIHGVRNGIGHAISVPQQMNRVQRNKKSFPFGLP